MLLHDYQRKLFESTGTLPLSILIPSIHIAACRLLDKNADEIACLADLLHWCSILLTKQNKSIEDCLYSDKKYGSGGLRPGKTGKLTIERLARRLSELWIELQLNTRSEAEIYAEITQTTSFIVQITEHVGAQLNQSEN